MSVSGFPFVSEKDFNNPKKRPLYITCYKWAPIIFFGGAIVVAILPPKIGDPWWPWLASLAFGVAGLGVVLQIISKYIAAHKTYSIIPGPEGLTEQSVLLKGWSKIEPDEITAIQPAHLFSQGFDLFEIRRDVVSQTYFVYERARILGATITVTFDIFP